MTVLSLIAQHQMLKYIVFTPHIALALLVSSYCVPSAAGIQPGYAGTGGGRAKKGVACQVFLHVV